MDCHSITETVSGVDDLHLSQGLAVHNAFSTCPIRMMTWTSKPIPVPDLTGLTRLVAQFKARHAVNIDQIPNLRSCTIQWQPKLHSIFEAKALKRLQITGLNWQKTDRLGRSAAPSKPRSRT